MREKGLHMLEKQMSLPVSKRERKPPRVFLEWESATVFLERETEEGVSHFHFRKLFPNTGPHPVRGPTKNKFFLQINTIFYKIKAYIIQKYI